MSYPVFYVPAGDVLPVMFNTSAGSTGASVTLTGLAVTDIEIYKDGSVTQRSSDAGYTLLDTDGIDFDAITGIHGFSIDTGDNTDAGFYTVGAWFTVVVSAVTVDAQTVNFIACQFRLMPAESIAGKPKVDVDAWLGTAAATPTVAGVPEVDITHVAGATTNVAALATNVDAILTDTAVIGAAGVGLTAVALADATSDGVIADAVWNAATATYGAAGSYGLLVETDLDAAISTRATPTNITAGTITTVGSVTGAVGSVTGAVGSVTGAVGSVTGNVTGSVGSLAAQAKTDVNAEVVDALATDTYAEPGQGAPAATATLSAKINYIYKFLRNKITTTSSQISIYDDAGTTVDQKSAISDNATTFTRGEFGTGP